MKTAHPDEVEGCLQHRGVMILKQFWAAGINDIWTVDQHVKLRQWGLYMHIGLEPVSDFILWLKIRWTNCNPRLVASYYCDVVPEHGGEVPSPFQVSAFDLV